MSAETMLLPERRPQKNQASRTGAIGTARPPVMDANRSCSSSDRSRENSAFRTAVHDAHDGPGKTCPSTRVIKTRTLPTAALRVVTHHLFERRHRLRAPFGA